MLVGTNLSNLLPGFVCFVSPQFYHANTQMFAAGLPSDTEKRSNTAADSAEISTPQVFFSPDHHPILFHTRRKDSLLPSPSSIFFFEVKVLPFPPLCAIKSKSFDVMRM